MLQSVLKTCFIKRIIRRLNLMDAHVSGGMDPIEMADAILKIINTKT
jgi:hypothetical protein